MNIAPMIWGIFPHKSKEFDPKNMLTRYEMAYQEVIGYKGKELHCIVFVKV